MPTVTPRILNPPFAFADLNTDFRRNESTGLITLSDAGGSENLVNVQGNTMNVGDIFVVLGQVWFTPTGTPPYRFFLRLDRNSSGPGFISWWQGSGRPRINATYDHDNENVVQIMALGTISFDTADPRVEMYAQAIGSDVEIQDGEAKLTMLTFSSIEP